MDAPKAKHVTRSSPQGGCVFPGASPEQCLGRRDLLRGTLGALAWLAATAQGVSCRCAPDMRNCNVCGKTSRFLECDGRVLAQCPNCESKERHRLLIHYLATQTDLWLERLDVLHFSPGAPKLALKAQPNLNYVTCDYFRTDEDLRLDLTQLAQPDEAWDVLIVYHVLEHIQRDRRAMAEMFRVMRPGARAFVQVPIERGRRSNYENPTITSERARARAFGQKDHVRKYGTAGFRRRLEDAGFQVEVIDYLAQLPADLVERHRMSGAFTPPLDESIWVLRRPL